MQGLQPQLKEAMQAARLYSVYTRIDTASSRQPNAGHRGQMMEAREPAGDSGRPTRIPETERGSLRRTLIRLDQICGRCFAASSATSNSVFSSVIFCSSPIAWA